jgi:hypothetical protein
MRKKLTGRPELKKIVGLGLGSGLLLAGLAFTAQTVALNLKSDLEAVNVHEQTVVTFTAQITPTTTPLPVKVRLSRLQWSGTDKEVALMHDDGSHGDEVKNDGIYSTQLKLKEPIIGLLSFTAEAVYPNHMKLRSRPLFLNVVGGVK